MILFCKDNFNNFAVVAPTVFSGAQSNMMDGFRKLATKLFLFNKKTRNLPQNIFRKAYM